MTKKGKKKKNKESKRDTDEYKKSTGGERRGRVDMVRDIAHKTVSALAGCSPLPDSGSIEVAEVQKKVVETLFPLLTSTGSSQASPMPQNNKSQNAKLSI